MKFMRLKGTINNIRYGKLFLLTYKLMKYHIAGYLTRPNPKSIESYLKFNFTRNHTLSYLKFYFLI